MSVALADEYPPHHIGLEGVYDATAINQQQERIDVLSKAFTRKYGRKPDFYARSPGRVNLIGEHIDYAGYAVLPMAIDRDALIAVAVSETGIGKSAVVSLANLDADKYPETTFEFEEQHIVTINPEIHEWSNYFKCGFKGALECATLPSSAKSIFAMVSGTVPTGAGVSSSSALVCASALATLVANNASLSKGDLVKAAIRGEHYAGVKTGGMDQSISIMGVRGSALLIEFYPKLKASITAFPVLQDAPVFVIANTLVVADKHVIAPTNYNLRVVETRLGAALLAKALGIYQQDTETLLDFRRVQDALFRMPVHAQVLDDVEQLTTMLSLVDKHLDPSPLSLVQIARMLDMTLEAVQARFIGDITIRADAFKIYMRAKHVFSEARRVLMFRNLLASANSSSLLIDLGRLMDESQASCRDLFECSCPELDELTVTLPRNAGAVGSRLTGAGWGGCTVSLVPESRVSSFLESVKNEYYFKHWPQWNSDPAALSQLDTFIFASKPGSGAATFVI